MNPGWGYVIVKDDEDDREALEVHGQLVEFEHVRFTNKGERIKTACGTCATGKRRGSVFTVIG